MPTAKVRSLQVRPIQSADLSFEVAGILGKQHATKAQLGVRVKGVDFSNLATELSKFSIDQPGRLHYVPTNIASYIDANYDFLFSLRNELLAANLQQAIAQREVAYLEKFLHRDKIISDMAEVFPSGPAPNGKLKRLETLRQLIGEHRDALHAAYESTQWNHVITDTVTTTRNTGDTNTKTLLNPVTMKNTAVTTNTPGGPHSTGSTQVIPQQWQGGPNGGWADLEKFAEPGFHSQQAISTNDLTHRSETRNTEFRHPSYENLIQEQRNQLNMQDEYFLHKTFSYRMPSLGTIIDKELEVIDHEILKAQIRYAQTFLFSPISGIVTSVYKDVGEAVQPGEPVIRVENDDKLLIVGLIQYKGLLRGDRKQTATITANSVYESSATLKVTGPLVSVRGHDADDDEWDVIIECSNEGKKLPINYSFDRESTVIDIV